MWIIVDSNNVVQDKSSHQVNLSRGKTFPGYQEIEITDNSLDVRLFDTYDPSEGILTKNIEYRAEKELYFVKKKMVESKVNIKESKSEGFEDVEAEYQNDYDTLDARKTVLEGMITSKAIVMQK